VRAVIGGVPVTFLPIVLETHLEPERQREFEIELAVGAVNQRVMAELTGYQRSVSNLLSQRFVSADEFHFSEVFNAGGMRSRGVRAAIQVRPIATKWIDWTSRGTLSLDRSIITELRDGLPQDVLNLFGAFRPSGETGIHRLEPGKSATQIIMVLRDGEIAAVGDSEPDFRVSWANALSLGNLTFTAHIDWQHGANIVNLMRLSYDRDHNSPDTEAAAKRLTADGLRPYVEDASFVKLREVSVSYALPARIAAHLGPLKRLELTVSGRNLLTFTGYSGLDPELSDLGLESVGRFHDIAPVPPTRSYWISVTAGI
jgi:hypothetical protein